MRSRILRQWSLFALARKHALVIPAMPIKRWISSDQQGNDYRIFLVIGALFFL